MRAQGKLFGSQGGYAGMRVLAWAVCLLLAGCAEPGDSAAEDPESDAADGAVDPEPTASATSAATDGSDAGHHGGTAPSPGSTASSPGSTAPSPSPGSTSSSPTPHASPTHAASPTPAGSPTPAASPSGPSPAAPEPTPATSGPTTWNITISGHAFEPAHLTIKENDTIRWVHADGGVPHTVTSDAGAFDSGTMGQGDAFSVWFQEPGSFPYHCDFHGGMTAQVTVEAHDGG